MGFGAPRGQVARAPSLSRMRDSGAAVCRKRDSVAGSGVALPALLDDDQRVTLGWIALGTPGGGCAAASAAAVSGTAPGQVDLMSDPWRTMGS